MKNKPEIILHIGTEKTGTSSIQQFLSQNRNKLLEDSVLYPKSPGSTNHIRLAAYSQSGNKRDDLKKQLGIADHSSLDDFRRVFRDSFYSELSNVDHSKLILSGEHCHSRLTTQKEIRNLKELLSQVSKSITVVVYFRRQDKMALSRYSTSLKAGRTNPHIFPKIVRELPYYFDFLKIYENWATVFGADCIKARICETARFVDQDLVKDFLNAANCTWRADFFVPVFSNASLQPKAQLFLKLLNKHLPRFEEQRPTFSRQGIINVLERHLSGTGLLPARAAAMEFYDKFRPSNAELKAKCFPKIEGELFENNFSDYPETEEQASLSPEDAIEIAALVFREQSVEANNLRCESLYFKAMMEFEKNAVDSAADYVKRALRFDSSNIDANQLLAEIYFRQADLTNAVRFMRRAVELSAGRPKLLSRLKAMESSATTS